MIAHLIAYSVMACLLLGVAALLLERVPRLYGRPARWVWVLALFGSILLPVVAVARAVLPSAAVASRADISAAVGEAWIGSVQPVVRAAPAYAGWWANADGVLLGLWGVMSLVLLAALAWGCARMGRQRRGWRAAAVGDVPVLVAPRTGPAVVGFWRPAIVLPEWVLKCEAEHQRLIVEHEREHIRAGDPRLVLGSLFVVALVPWNLPLWWQVHRLRLAVEMDCDARVLRSRHSTREYGQLLLEVGRRAAGGPLPMAAFSEPASFLERRIRQITARPPRRRGLLAAVLALGALAAPLAARALPVPELSVEARQSLGVPRQSAVPADTVRPRLLNASEVISLLERNYPRKLRDAGVGGSVLLRADVDREGKVTNTSIVHMTNDNFAKAAGDAVYQARFAPATARNGAVSYTLPMAVEFRPGQTGTDAIFLLIGASHPPVSEQLMPTRAPASAVLDADSAMDIAATGARTELTNQRAVIRALEDSYPQMYRDAGVGGTATVRFVINRQGKVDSSTVAAVAATNPAFAEAAARVVRQARFRPIRYKGEAVRVWATLPITFAVERPRDSSIPVIEAPPAADASGTMREQTPASPEIINTREVFRALEAAYPKLYADAGVGGSATLRFMIDTAGTADMQTVRVVSATNPAFAAAARQALAAMRFRPVMYKGEAVRVWITLPVTFQPSRKTGTAPEPAPLDGTQSFSSEIPPEQIPHSVRER